MKRLKQKLADSMTLADECSAQVASTRLPLHWLPHTLAPSHTGSLTH